MIIPANKESISYIPELFCTVYDTPITFNDFENIISKFNSTTHNNETKFHEFKNITSFFFQFPEQ